MRVAVFGDVHGNLIALERFVAETRATVDAYLCLGDVVDYGPWNDECLEIVCQLPGIVFLEGNHERLFLGTEDLKHELPLVQAFFKHSHASFSRYDLIQKLPRRIKLGSFECTHTIGGQSLYVDTPIDLVSNHIIGHTHHQFRVERAGFTLLNPGSVGQNRKWIDMVDFAIVETESEEISMRSVRYDVDMFVSELRRRHYPADCLSYYNRKPRKGA